MYAMLIGKTSFIIMSDRTDFSDDRTSTKRKVNEAEWLRVNIREWDSEIDRERSVKSQRKTHADLKKQKNLELVILEQNPGDSLLPAMSLPAANEVSVRTYSDIFLHFSDSKSCMVL